MDLRPGCRLTVAPSFYLPIDWADRVRLGTIVDHGGRCLPGPTWRAPTPAELQMLVADPQQPDAPPLYLFAIPQHLQAAFWTTLEQPPGSPVPHPEGFDRFADELARFLDFKRLPLPPAAVCDLVVGKPGQASIQWDAAAGEAIGLTFNLAPWLDWPLHDPATAPGLWGGCNVGDEAVSVLFVNRTAAQLAADLAPDSPRTLGALAHAFLTRYPTYRLVRLRLEPGECYRIPPGGLLIDACTLDMQGPAMLVMIRNAADSGLTDDAVKA